MKKHILDCKKRVLRLNSKTILLHTSTLFLITFLLLTFFGFSFAQQSGGSTKVTPADIDQQIQGFVQSKQYVTVKEIKESKKKIIRSMIADIKSMCGNFNTNTYILTSAKCTTKDPKTGYRITFSMNCQNGACKFTKEIHKPLKITMTPRSVREQATPNLPPQSKVSTEKWLKIFASMIYVILTVYLFIAASTNLLKREILFLIVDLSLWAALTTAMYVVIKGGF